MNHSDDEIRRIADRAAKEPILRSLFPYPSMQNLRFSRSTTYPYDHMPYILTVVPGDCYEVRGGDNEPLAVGNLDQVVRELAHILSSH